MAVDEWLSRFAEKVDEASLRAGNARALVQFVKRYAGGVATFVEARRDAARELVILDFRTGRPQRPVYPILSVERLGVVFAGDEALPYVHVLRDDFPDTEHQQLVPEKTPRAVCIDDRPWPGARLGWTPAELIQRTLSWFGRAARGELHDARQPIDPLFLGSPLNFIISRAALESGASEDLVAEHDPKQSTIVRVRPMRELAGPTNAMEPFCIAGYRVQAEKMKRLQFAPTTLASLSDMLFARGIDLKADLAKRFAAWWGEGTKTAWRLNARFAIIVEMPIVGPAGAEQPGTDVRAFVTCQSAGDIAVAIGAAMKVKSSDEGSKVGFVQPLSQTPVIDEAALSAIEVQSAEVHFEFDRALATKLSGRTAIDTRKAVLVGAGAIGSHLGDCLVREGRFVWTVIDDDRILPHNLARHIVHKELVAKHKAEMVARYLNGVLAESTVAAAIPSNLLTTGDPKPAIDEALNGAEFIVDATASIVAARFLSDHAAKARRLSAFFNPGGDAAVLLAEPADRSLTLRDLEAQYLGLLLRHDGLSEHLAKPTRTISYTGACRAITNLVPQSRVSILSGLAAIGIGKAVDAPAGAISTWSLGADGSVTCHAANPAEVWRYTVNEWTIAIDTGLVARLRAMRSLKLPNETGGILIGLVDIPARSTHIVEGFAAPADSIESPGGFVRGVHGVDEAIEDVRRRTDGQLRYVGEWHSHPRRASARPSAIDAVQLDWLAALMGMDSLPGLMVIAADRELSVIFADQEARRAGGSA